MIRTLGERPEGPHKRADTATPSLVPNREAGNDAAQEDGEGEGDVARDSSLRHGPRGHRPSFSDGFGGFTLSGGNFHGEYPAKVLDYLAIAVHEISNISERRIERLVNSSLSKLPAFLVKEGGTSPAALARRHALTRVAAGCRPELRVHDCALYRGGPRVREQGPLPSGQHRLPVHQRCQGGPRQHGRVRRAQGHQGDGARGDCAWAARLEPRPHAASVLIPQPAALQVVAIELMAACQGLDFLRPLKTTKPLEALHALVRRHVAHWDRDRHMSPDIEASAALLRSSQVWTTVLPFLPAEDSGEEAW